MDVSPLNAVDTGLNNIKKYDPNSDYMGKETFLKLLVAQLENQDPLSPMDNLEFTSQLAQFSSLEQLTDINKNIEALQAYQSATNNAQAVSLIDKVITASGNSINVNNGTADEIMFELEGNAAGIIVSIYDSADNLINIIRGGNQNAGMNKVAWDGTDNAGRAAPDGLYTFEVLAADVNQDPVEVKTFLTGTVDRVIFKNNTPYLLTGNSEVPLENVVSVSKKNEITR